jgi:DNA polymerase elongation subunit (family B)
MVMDRECIADKGVWTAKKRYMMNVYDSEGIRYETPKMKIMGIETTRSSTPQIVREKLKEVIKLILTKDNESVIEYIDGFKKEFKNYSPAEIAFPRSCNGLKKYKDPSLIYKKSTPIAVKGSLIYNNLISIHGLQRKYQNITDGEKVKFLYLKEPNPIGERVISFQQTIPQEFDLNGFVDYDLQFQKTFLDPLNTILEKIDWQSEKISTLEDLFI